MNPATNQTFVEVDLAGDSGNYWPDFEIVLSGLMPLTAANFALTAAQSTTDIANGAALTDTKVQTPTGAPLEYAYTNVKGKTYSSYEAFDVTTGGVLTLGAEDLNLSSTKDQLLLFDPGMTVTRGGAPKPFRLGRPRRTRSVIIRPRSLTPPAAGPRISSSRPASAARRSRDLRPRERLRTPSSWRRHRSPISPPA